MALVWQHRLAGVHYEVRSAGHSLRLYTDGVFHSQYNPRQLLTGHVWDLLMLPAFFYPPGQIKRVLLMGVGGGAVIHQLRHYAGVESITGVELNPVHLSVAKKFFSLKGKGIRLIEADAIEWLKNYNGPAFDMIIDDLFAEKEGEPVAVIDAGTSWFRLMLRHLSSDGVIVRNFIDKNALLESAPLRTKLIGQRFKYACQLTSHYNENFVGAFFRSGVSSGDLRQRLRQTPGLNPDLKSSRLRYRMRRLSLMNE